MSPLLQYDLICCTTVCYMSVLERKAIFPPRRGTALFPTDPPPPEGHSEHVVLQTRHHL